MIPKAGHVLSVKSNGNRWATDCAAVEELAGGYRFTLILPTDFTTETGRTFKAGERYAISQFNVQAVAEVANVEQKQDSLGIDLWLQKSNDDQ